MRSAAARLLGGSNGSRALSFVGGNGGSKSVSAGSRLGSLGASSSSNSTSTSNFDGRGTYLIFNMGDGIFISDLNSQDKVSFTEWGFNKLNNEKLQLVIKRLIYIIGTYEGHLL